MKLEKLKNKIKKIFSYNLKRGVEDINYIQVKEIIKNQNAILLDVRSKQEYKEYHLDGAICIPVYDLKENVEKIIQDKNTTIIVYCQSGKRSKEAKTILLKLGYTNIYSLNGGIQNI